MLVRLVQITTRRSGATARKEQSREVSTLSVGRGTDNELVLNELTIGLHHASFEKRSDGVHVRRQESADLLVNGQLTESERLEPGDVVKIGHYELRVVAPEQGEDLALEVEQVVRPGDEREELRQRTRMGVERGFFSRRRLAWSFVLLVLGFFLVAPLLSTRVDDVWNSGTISRKHAFIAEDCERCHTTFDRVQNEGCLECHATAANHTSAKASPEALNQVRCASCHVEHEGLSGLAQIENARCAGCHRDLHAIYADTQLGDASDFQTQHPQFRLSLVETPGSGLTELTEWSPRMEEHPGIEFNHYLHVGQLESESDGEHENLRCDACHVLEQGGRSMQPIDFEKHCQDCHSLAFDPRLEDDEAYHGDPVEMREKLRDLYTDRALRGLVTDPQAPAAIRNLRPGQLSDADTQLVLRWVNEKVTAADRRVMEACGECHGLLPGEAADGGTAVVPVELLSVRMPRSNFRHYTHRPFTCASCHPAAAVYDPDNPGERPDWSLPGAGSYVLLTPQELKAETGLEPSESAEDVLLPGIESCRGCHGGARSSPPLVASACVLCHSFHREEYGSMAKRMAELKSD